MDTITLRGVRVHNLRGIDVEFPRNRLTVITGVSGAGKTSLAFDTLYAEAQRRYLQGFSTTTRQYLERFDQPDADHIGDLLPAIGVRSSPGATSPRATVGSISEVGELLGLVYARLGICYCPRCQVPARSHRLEEILAHAQSLPSGTRVTIAYPIPIGPDREAWLAECRERGQIRLRIVGIDIRSDDPPSWNKLPACSPEPGFAWVLFDRLEAGKTSAERWRESIQQGLTQGQGRCAFIVDNQETFFDRRPTCSKCGETFPPLEPSWFNPDAPLGACPICQGTGMHAKKTCVACGGKRLNPLSQAVRLFDRSFAESTSTPIDSLVSFVDTASWPERHDITTVVPQIRSRLGLLQDLALGYLTLDRPASALAATEMKRLHLTRVLASNLVGALYILDEPTAGLPPAFVPRAVDLLRKLRDAGNTVVVVEHQHDVLRAADWIIDLGPGAGEEGGRLLYQGPVADLSNANDSLTADYFLGTHTYPEPGAKRRQSGLLRLEIVPPIEFPLGVLCVVTAEHGGALIRERLWPALQQEPGSAKLLGTTAIGEAVLIDQTPLSRSQRANPVTYLKIFDEIRKLFAETSEARIRNFGPGHFSFNQPGGRCERCEGQGQLTVDMQFLADVTVTCPECQGARFQRDILQVKVRNRNIAEVLDLTVREAFRFFRAQGQIERRLKPLLDVGLEYLKLGQSADTLSGGEAQRLKLAGHLGSARKARTLFLLMEPTIGLHPDDVVRLLYLFDNLLATGHSLIVADQHPALMQHADVVID